MNIRKATLQDLPRIMEIFAIARQFMVKNGNPHQWGPTNWPPEELIKQDIQQGHSYVCLNQQEQVIGTFFFEVGENVDSDYNEIFAGQWIGHSHYGVIHRLAADGSEKGIGTFCINWAYEQCGHIRIDTHEDNKVLQTLLGKLGFTHCGTIYLSKSNEPRLAYEKV